MSASATVPRPNYEDVSRNLSVEDEAKIRASKTLPPEWAGNTKLELAHNLFWMEASDWVGAHEAALAERCKDGSYPV